jgi:4-hydroxythreonine-4-phosphate dehydrogenase
MGEPAGIGPDIILQLAAQKPALFSEEKIIVIGSTTVLESRAKLLGIPFCKNTFSILEVPLSQPVVPGQLNQANASFVIDMLTLATDNAMQKKFSSIVTAPIHKGVLNDAGFSFAGHTDFFAKYTNSKTVMMLMTPSLKVALLTDHIPLRAVPDAVTEKNLSDCLDIILRDFQQRLRIPNPTILVCGLNPHAGESGYLGTEEQTTIIPVIEKYRAQNHRVIGPIGADVAFTEHYRNQADVILALYHDQGLPVIKYSGFHEAINVTLGLPFIRTSVDHGTALDIAGTGRADVSSLHHALLFAEKISHEHTHAA